MAQLVPTHRFFDAGGTSLMAMQIAQRVEAATGLHVCALDIFRYLTLAEFGQHLVAGPKSLPSQAIEEARRRAEQRRNSMARNNFRAPVQSVPRQV